MKLQHFRKMLQRFVRHLVLVLCFTGNVFSSLLDGKLTEQVSRDHSHHVVPSEPARSPADEQASEQVISVVLNDPHVGLNKDVIHGNREDFIRLRERPSTVAHNQVMMLEYQCLHGGVVGIELRVTSQDITNTLIYFKMWTCPQHTLATLTTRVRLTLPDRYAYRPTLDNPDPITPSYAAIRAWVIDLDKFKQIKIKNLYYQVALVKVLYRVDLLNPWLRPNRPDQECWSWIAKQQAQLAYQPKCSLEQDIVKLITFPVVLSGGFSGVHRQVKSFKYGPYEGRRKELAKWPKFTLIMWVYVYEYCPSGHALCSLMQRIDWNDTYHTPLIFVNKKGHLHIQVASRDRGQFAFITNDYVLPKRQWVRLVLVCQGRKVDLTSHSGPYFSVSFKTGFRFSLSEMGYFDDTQGVYVFGGSELMPSFKGYIGEAVMHRNRLVDVSMLPFPSVQHPMFRLQLIEHDGRCHEFLDWVQYRIYQCRLLYLDYISRSINKNRIDLKFN